MAPSARPTLHVLQSLWGMQGLRRPNCLHECLELIDGWQHLAWWERGFALWLARAAPTDSLCFACELGPPPYAITGPGGHERADRWADVRQLHALVRERWQRALNAVADSAPAVPASGIPATMT